MLTPPSRAGPADSVPARAAVERFDRRHRRGRAGEGGDGRHPLAQRGGADLVAVGAGAAAERRVDDEADLPALDEVHHVGLALEDLVHHVDRDAEAGERRRGAPRGVDGEPEHWRRLREDGRRRLVAVADRKEHVALGGQRHAGSGHRLAERRRERLGDAHDLAGGLHLRTELGVGAGEPAERQHGLLDADVLGYASLEAHALRATRRGSRAWRSAPWARRSPC